MAKIENVLGFFMIHKERLLQKKKKKKREKLMSTKTNKHVRKKS